MIDSKKCVYTAVRSSHASTIMALVAKGDLLYGSSYRWPALSKKCVSVDLPSKAVSNWGASIEAKQ